MLAALRVRFPSHLGGSTLAATSMKDPFWKKGNLELVLLEK